MIWLPLSQLIHPDQLQTETGRYVGSDIIHVDIGGGVESPSGVPPSGNIGAGIEESELSARSLARNMGVGEVGEGRFVIIGNLVRYHAAILNPRCR